jgi:thiol-disulfide isomerase/thioredoxin
MKFKLIIIGCICSVIIISQPFKQSNATSINTNISLPEFTHKEKKDWINSKPISKKDLLNKIVLIDIWTFDCWNCYRSFPWLNALEKKFKDQDFQIIGIHSPEFEHEKKYKNILNKVKQFNLHHPIMIDNDFSYWKALNNKYWPTFYLIDKQGNIRHIYIGETNSGTPKAKTIETAIKKLLAI